MIRHIVLFRLTDEGRSSSDSLIRALEGLPGAVPEIEALTVGGLLNDGEYDYALTVDVEDHAALERYREHPSHVPVARRLRELSRDVVVADILIPPL